VPVIAWEPKPVALTAEEAFGVSLLPGSKRLAETAAWLDGLLSAGPMLSTEVERRAWEAGFTKRTLVRAMQGLGVVAFHEGYQAPWQWRLRGQEAVPVPAERQGGEPAAEKTG